MFAKIHNWYASRSISTKITGFCTIFFIALIALINVVMVCSISYALYHPAEATIEHGIQSAQKILADSENYPDDLIFHSIHKALVSGVVLRIFDEKKNLIFDTNELNYPSNEMFEENMLKKPPLLADKKMDVAQMRNALIYRSSMTFFRNGEYLTLYFYRTITSQIKIFKDLERFMLLADLLSIVFSVIISIFISKKILQPIKNVTALANKIAQENERERVKDRLPLPPVNDEITELAKTFNVMLDLVQSDITRHKEFVSNAAHELKTPLTVIEGYVDILKKYGDKDKSLRDESVEVIAEETQNIKMLLKNLRLLTRNDDDALELNKEYFDLAEVVSNAFRRATTIAGNNHEVNLLQNDSAQIYGDKTAILQILRIFLDNAIKYTPSGGAIQLSSVKQNDDVLVSIADNGIGIAAENFEKIFERGVRISDNEFVGKTKGSGIGLFIAKMIADGHGITIDLESTVGKGTTFTLKIPLI